MGSVGHGGNGGVLAETAHTFRLLWTVFLFVWSLLFWLRPNAFCWCTDNAFIKPISEWASNGVGKSSSVMAALATPQNSFCVFFLHKQGPCWLCVAPAVLSRRIQIAYYDLFCWFLFIEQCCWSCRVPCGVCISTDLQSTKAFSGLWSFFY
jgi:hypothetical protein